jgi:CheY-like chemotaxis protein
VVPGDYVLISVTDDGVGMPSSVRERAFEPFFTTKEVGKGTGLGLSMVYGFVKQSNGHVAIYSEASLGTTVRIYLPPNKSSAGHSAPKHDSAPEPAGGSGTILVVEDDAFVRGYAVALLESLGYRVIVAASGREALDKLAGGPSIDLLFSDIVMPGGVSGWELAERAQALKPGLRILLTSGYSLETLATQKPGSRLVVLNKPYRKADLAHRLKELWESGPPV